MDIRPVDVSADIVEKLADGIPRVPYWPMGPGRDVPVRDRKFTVLGLYRYRHDRPDDPDAPTVARVMLHDGAPAPGDPIRRFAYWPDEDLVTMYDG